MSVMVISYQQMADALHIAKRFVQKAPINNVVSWCNSMSKLSIQEREELFCRLYFYNELSYEKRYEENVDVTKLIQESARDFERIMRLAENPIGILQFIQTLHFLHYNIEVNEISGTLMEYDGVHETNQYGTLVNDMKLLESFIADLSESYTRSQLDLLDVKWVYY